MTYEEKLNLIIAELVEAKKRTRVGQPVKVFVTKQSELIKKIIPQEVHELLLQLQDDEKILTIKEIPTDLKTSWEVDLDKLDYFLIDIPETFNSWYEQYLLKQKSKPENLDWLNLVKVLNVCIGINEQLQIAQRTRVSIPLLPYPNLGGFPDLFPFDSQGTRQKYQQHRREGVQYLLKQGIVNEIKEHDEMLGYGSLEIQVNLVEFEGFYKRVWNEYERRNKANKKEEKPKTESLKIDPKKVTAKVTYNTQKGELDIEGKKVKFKKESFRAKLLELLLKDDKSRKKEWSWDEVIEVIEDTKDEELTKENKNKFYPACDGLSKHIALKTGVNDLLLYNKSTVQINPKYL